MKAPIKQKMYEGGFLHRVWIRFFKYLASAASNANDNQILLASGAYDIQYDFSKRLTEIENYIQAMPVLKDHSKDIKELEKAIVFGIYNITNNSNNDIDPDIEGLIYYASR